MTNKRLRFSDDGHLTNGNGRLHEPLLNTATKSRLFSRPRAKTENQQMYMDTIDSHDIVFCTGPAGSGKTHLAVGMAVQGLRDEEYKKIIAIRPCVGVGKTLGYLPGCIEDKVEPYLRPIFDELQKFFTSEEIRKLRMHDIIELGSLEHIRGRTLTDAFVILDEAQNCTSEELKAFLTRLGFGSKFVINGCLTRDKHLGKYTQCDLPKHEQGALEYQVENLHDLEGIGFSHLHGADIVRHPLVRRMEERGL